MNWPLRRRATLPKVNIFLQKNWHTDDRIIACFRSLRAIEQTSKELIDGLQPADRSIIHCFSKPRSIRYTNQRRNSVSTKTRSICHDIISFVASIRSTRINPSDSSFRDRTDRSTWSRLAEPDHIIDLGFRRNAFNSDLRCALLSQSYGERFLFSRERSNNTSHSTIRTDWSLRSPPARRFAAFISDQLYLIHVICDDQVGMTWLWVIALTLNCDSHMTGILAMCEVKFVEIEESRSRIEGVRRDAGENGFRL